MDTLPLADDGGLDGKNRKTSGWAVLLDILIILIILFLVLYVVYASVFTRVAVVGESMEPTIMDGTYVLSVSRTPKYGDVVIVDGTSKGETKRLIKRVIAMEGDTVWLDHGQLYIMYSDSDDKEPVKVDEDYLDPDYNTASLATNTYPRNRDGSVDSDGHTVAEGCMFVMGDNRNVSADSRSDYGDIPYENCVGVVVQWSIKYSGAITSWYNFWEVTLPGWFRDD